MFDVVVKSKIIKAVLKMPKNEQKTFMRLVNSLKATGAEQPTFKNYSKLGVNKYHCHLSHKWVACWYCENGSLIIEVYYAGSRESAPYAKH